MTTHEYESGRLVRSVTMDEPLWTDDDLDAALDWQFDRSLVCSGCGHPADETTDPEFGPAWYAEPVVCGACAARERRARSLQDGGRELAPGTRFRVRNRAKD